MKAIKELGQHFLTDPGIASDIADLGEIVPHDRIWEIGPGSGILTAEILKRGAILEAFELDKRMAQILLSKFSHSFSLQITDILRCDWAHQISLGTEPLKLIANIPYQITSPLLYRLEQHHSSFSRIVMMLQKEVAERLTAKPGNKSFGPLTLRLGLIFEIHIAFMVGKEHFDPVPQVDSAVIVMTPRPDPPQIPHLPLFLQLITAAFAHRRKTLKNNLLPMIGKDKVQELQLQSDLDLKRRAETLNESEFILLSNIIAEL